MNFWWSMSPRSQRRIIAVLYHSTVIASGIFGIQIGNALNWQQCTNMSLYLILIHALTFRIIPICALIERHFIPMAVCPGCQFVLDFGGHAGCTCGYTSPVGRHLFEPCPMCMKTPEWINCPRCLVSILL